MEVGFGELGLQKLGELGEVEGFGGWGVAMPCTVEVGVGVALRKMQSSLIVFNNAAYNLYTYRHYLGKTDDNFNKSESRQSWMPELKALDCECVISENV